MKLVTEAEYRARIDRVVRAIADDPARARSLEDLARLAHFSRFHFHRVYRAMTGESVIETVRRLRLTLAAHLLATTDAAITEIATEAGYQSVQTFSRAFSSFTTLAPRAFRERRIRLSELVKGPEKPILGGSEMKVEIVECSPMRAHVIQHHGPMTRASHTFAKLWKWQLDHGVAGTSKEAIGIFYGDVAAEGDHNFRYFAGVVFEKPIKPADGVELLEVPGGKYASYRLVGPHDGIPPAFQQLYGEWLPRSGHVPADRPALEIYRNNPYDTPASELITDLLIPIR